VQEEGAPWEKVHVVLNGIDFSRIRVSDREAPARLRREWCPEGAHLLVVPGRLHPEKGHTHVFQALPAVRRRLTAPVVVVVAGAGPFESAYREEIRSLGCEDIVRFLGFRRDLSDVIAAADLVVLPSVAEAFGLVVTEALYLGTPIVATHVGGIPEIVEDGVDGVLVPPADSKALADAVVRLLGDPERRRLMASAGRERVRDRFSFEKMMRAYEQLYDRLIEGCPQSR
jgi:glycosyltransferase involved in cell wall biosynthesis